MRALVTGGLGFVGRHLVEHLRQRGDDVAVIDHHGEHAVDITDGDALRIAIAQAAPDAVFHLAGWADVGGSWKEPVAAFRANAEGTLNVLLACAAAEDTPNAVDDGPVVATALALIDGERVLAVVPIPEVDGHVLKIEGLALREVRDGRVYLLAVVDADDPDTPSAELELRVVLTGSS